MNIHAVIPTRGDRPDFVKFAVQQMESQTVKPDFINVVDYPPESDAVDLASRFKCGIQKSLEMGADLIFFIEDDDFYRPEYIETMLNLWTGAEKPDLFGLDVTIYYHLGLKMSGSVKHPGRASMYNTMITKDFDLSVWPDENPNLYLDIKIWKNSGSKKAVTPKDTLCLGIKHGHGKCGGSMHAPDRFLSMFRETKMPDGNLSFLSDFTGPGFWFYKAIINKQEKAKCL